MTTKYVIKSPVWMQKSSLFLQKHSPEILTGLGIVGMLSAIGSAIKATPKAMKQVEDRKEELNTDKLSVFETTKTTLKTYMPTIVLATTSTACLVGASATNYKRNAALATACTLSESMLQRYKNEVIETIGQKKEEQISKTAAVKEDGKLPETKEEKNQVNTVIVGNADIWCKDPYSGRLFKSNVNKIQAGVNKLNERLMYENELSLNEFYTEIDLEPTDLGNELGWSILKTGHDLIEIEPVPILTPDNQVCVELHYINRPRVDYLE